MDQMKTQSPPYPPYFSPYPFNSNQIPGFKPSFPKAHCSPNYQPILNLNPCLKLGYWELLSPALFGTAGALFLSLFSNSKDQKNEPFAGTFFKLALIGYGLGATASVSFAVYYVIIISETSLNNLIFSIAGAISSIILLFASEYLLLYRFFPSSFKGYVGDDFCTQFLSFLYFSVTTIATANLGDILPTNTTPRLLIATEIAFGLYVLASGIQLCLGQRS